MSRTISSSYASRVTLAGGDNPLSITGTIDAVTGSNALYGGAATQWSITNSGVIDARAASANGVVLAGGGSVVNQAHATISTGSTLDAFGAAIRIGTASASGAGSVENFGLITNLNTFTGTGFATASNASSGPGPIVNVNTIVGLAYAVALNSSGTVRNEAGASLQAGQGGISITDLNGSNATNSVLNEGTIVAAVPGSAVGYGIFLSAGTIFNTGPISGFRYGIGIAGEGSIANGGTITGDTGVLMNGGGFVFNEGVIIGTTHAGINALLMPITVVNAGTITSLGPIHVALAIYGGRLVVEHGAVFNGLVSGGLGALELVPNVGMTIGLGTTFQNFASVQFDADANATITGDTIAIDNLTTTGFRHGDAIVIDQANETIAGLGAGTLTLTGSATVHLFVGSQYPFLATDYSAAPDGSGDTVLTVIPCFAAGTRILTLAGEVPVEDLQPADLQSADLRPAMRVVSLAHARPLPVRWVGRQRSRVPPVRIAAGAFGDHVPHRPLYLSPDHAVRVDGALVPVRHLVNGASIVALPCGEVEYFHVELAEHAVLLADGLPAESYLDTGNREALAITRKALIWQPNSS